MKKYMAVFLAALLALSVASCGMQNNTSDTSGTSSAGETSQLESVSVPEEKGSYTGVIVDATMNSITVEGSDGKELTFSTGEDSDINQFEGLEIGQAITIEYQGTIENDDASGVLVTRIQVEKDAQQGPDDSQSGGVISGTVVEASMNSVSIVNANQQQIDFSLNDDTQIDLPEGIMENQKITVEYVGQLNGTDASGVTVKRISAAE
ncbi:MAG: hypothetical protein ACOX60_12300 [Massiliimalia sp.]|jgi:hypothetical protein